MSDKQCSEFVHQRPATGTREQRQRPATGTSEQRLSLLLLQKSANRKRQREAELPEQRERRLQRQREYQRAYRRQRAAKTMEQTRMNVVTMGEHDVSDCTNGAHDETSLVPDNAGGENKRLRLAQMKAYSYKTRSKESDAEREIRLIKMRVHKQQTRSTESDAEREIRLALMRAHEQQTRSTESDAEREIRLVKMRAHKQQTRSTESDAEREIRLAKMRAHKQQTGSIESDVEREIRLEKMRAHEQQTRSTEGDTKRKIRLEKMQAHSQERRNKEDQQQRALRLYNTQRIVTAAQRVVTNETCLADSRQETHFYQKSVLKTVKQFHLKMGECDFTECSTCRERFPSMHPHSHCTECTRCSRDKKEPKLYSADNGMDPGPVPPELLELTQVEEMLISSVMPIMSLYHLPHGQFGYSGHIINLPQDVATFVKMLPRSPSQLDVLLVRRQGAAGSHKDFRVRRSKVMAALQWLKQHNTYYHDIHIDEAALSQLPVDGDLTTLPSITLDNDQEFPAGETEDPYSSHLSGTFVPMMPRQGTQQEMVRQGIADKQQPQRHDTQPVPWPQVGDMPINEFRTEGYMARAFPTLFPTGAADFNAPRVRHVTIGYYFKHLLMYQDGRFAQHPRFRFFALNTEMRWRALQVGRIYIKQHPRDAQLSVQDLKDMVGQQGERFSKQVTHFGNTLRGTASYWFRQRSRLISMVDTLGLPTVFFTHSAADLQWPELARLMCPDDPTDPKQRHKALVQNPAIADWFFYQRVQVYLKHFYTDVLGATDYWLRFEWQHRGSPHVHGLAWLPNAPNIEQAFASGSADTVTTNNITQYIDSVVCTSNPAMYPGSIDTTCPPQTNPHVCNKPFSEVEDYERDLAELIATCQRHTRCSPAYCLRMKNGKQVCRFGYPKPLQEETTLGVVDGELELNTARNDPLVNSYNRIQLSSWRANVDMQYCLSRQKVIEYVVKYASKCEPRSEPLKKVYKGIVQALSDDDKPVKAVQKLLLNSVGERDFSAQETCHLLLQLPLIMCSREFIVLSLDGSRAVEDSLEEDKPATKLSILDHYKARPESNMYEHMTLMNFAQGYSMPHNLGDEPTHKTKKVVVVVRPYYAKDPNSPHFEQYCKQKLMLHVPFRNEEELLDGQNAYTEAYARFVMSGNVPQCLQDDIDTFMQLPGESDSGESEGEVMNTNDNSSNARQVEEWMLICQSYPQLDQHVDTQGEDVDWLEAGRAYPNLKETPRFIIKHKESQVGMANTCTHTNDPQLLQGKQLHVYREIQAHLDGGGRDPLHMIVSGTAGTGKSFLIGCLRSLLTNKVKVVAPTGVAAFNIHGCTLHSLLSLPTRGEFKDLEGERLHSLQQIFAEVRYIIIDEMSMVGRKLFGQVDKRLRQAFPHRADEVLGGCSCILFGDFGQLPPVMDLPLYSADARSALSDLGRTAYQCFNKAIVLTRVMRQTGEDPQQVRFRDILMSLRDGHLTIDDWKHLMTRSAACVTDFESFHDALHLYPTVESVAEHNLTKLKHCTHPVAQIKAVHSGPNADRASSDDASGLEAVIHIAKGARVMLISNLWVEAGLVNGAMGTVEAICYQSGGPPALPTAVMVRFDAYTGPTLSDGTVPIVPVRRSWMSGSSACSRLQLPIKLAWAITIHKAQGLTLDKVLLDIGPKEFCAGLTFVALSRVRNLNSLVFHPPFDFQRVASLAKSQRHIERCLEDARLLSLSNN